MGACSRWAATLQWRPLPPAADPPPLRRPPLLPRRPSRRDDTPSGGHPSRVAIFPVGWSPHPPATCHPAATSPLGRPPPPCSGHPTTAATSGPDSTSPMWGPPLPCGGYPSSAADSPVQRFFAGTFHALGPQHVGLDPRGMPPPPHLRLSSIKYGHPPPATVTSSIPRRPRPCGDLSSAVTPPLWPHLCGGQAPLAASTPPRLSSPSFGRHRRRWAVGPFSRRRRVAPVGRGHHPTLLATATPLRRLPPHCVGHPARAAATLRRGPLPPSNGRPLSGGHPSAARWGGAAQSCLGW